MKKKQQAQKAVKTGEKKVPAKPYKIESGIKVSEPTQRSGDGQPGRVTATTHLMKVGDSFLIKDEVEAIRAIKQIRDLHRRERLGGGKRFFVARRLKNGLRIWRTA